VASAWMDEGFVEGVRGKGWGCGIYRTDVWMPVFEAPALVAEVGMKGEQWSKSWSPAVSVLEKSYVG